MVFASDLDRVANPIGTRLAGVAVGTVLMASVAVGLASPRTLAVTVPAIALSVVLAFLFSGKSVQRLSLDGHGRSEAAVLAFLAFGLLSALWADKPVAVLVAIGTAIFYFAAGIIMTFGFMAEARRNTYHIAEGFWIGLLAGLIYLLIEIESGQMIKLTIYTLLDVPKDWLRPAKFFHWSGNKLISIDPDDLTRSIAPVTLLLWSALYAMRTTSPGSRVRLWTTLLYGIAGFVILKSEHETSKVAFVVSSLVFAISWWRPVWSLRLLALGWVAACLSVVPISLTLYERGFHMSPALQFTLRHRIVIWNHTAEESLKAPIIGVGAGMMYQLDPEGEIADPDTEMKVNQPHAHNVYLQTWFELGAVGVILLTFAGLVIVDSIGKLGGEAERYAQATFASATTIAAASYGVWQSWFLAMFALCVPMFVIACRVNGTAAISSDD